ncbi:MAG TPA: YciI family protein [Polyangiaceae bacterium]|jgi:hypothetical protein|nr:YciI family protein [Polyangiaceae bacterium]
MRFMMIVKSNAKSEAGILPDEKLLSDMGKYNDELVKSGVLLAGEGLQASSKGARVRLSGKKITVVDGPFTEAKELVAGFWVIQVKSRQDAIEWAKRVPGTEGEIELRQIFELSDFPVSAAEKPDGWRAQEQRFRDAADPKAPSPAKPKRKPGTNRFMIIHKNNPATETMMPAEKDLGAMWAIIDEQIKAGALLAAEGLQPSSKGARVRASGTQRTVIDGPFAESKELVAGYSIIQVKSKEEAVAFAKRCIGVTPEGVTEGEIEVRQVFELSDFPVDPAEKKDGWRQKEQAFRDRAGQ